MPSEQYSSLRTRVRLTGFRRLRSAPRQVHHGRTPNLSSLQVILAPAQMLEYRVIEIVCGMYVLLFLFSLYLLCPDHFRYRVVKNSSIAAGRIAASYVSPESGDLFGLPSLQKSRNQTVVRLTAVPQEANRSAWQDAGACQKFCV